MLLAGCKLTAVEARDWIGYRCFLPRKVHRRSSEQNTSDGQASKTAVKEIGLVAAKPSNCHIIEGWDVCHIG